MLKVKWLIANQPVFLDTRPGLGKNPDNKNNIGALPQTPRFCPAWAVFDR